jgi:ketosteroid isomerase-like protein
VSDKLESIRRLYNEGWCAGDLEVALSELHPEVVWTAIESAPDAGTRHGHSGARAYMQDWLDDFDLGATDLQDPIERGHRVVATLHATATGKGSGVETEIVYGALFEFVGDKIARIHEYATRPEAEAALAEEEVRSTPGRA